MPDTDHSNARTDGPPACVVCGSHTRLLYRGLHDRRHGCPGAFDIARCERCGFCRTVPAPSRDDLGELYRRYYPRATLTPETVTRAFERQRARPALQRWWQGAGTECYWYVPPGSRVLDVGCGDGSSLLMARALGAREVTGVEVDTNLRPIAHALGLDLHLGQLADLPEAKGVFDCVLGRQMLEHEPEPLAMLLEMRRRLAPGGCIVLSVPNVDALSRRAWRERWLHWHVPFHVNHFSRASLERLAEASGLGLEELRTVTPNDWTRYQLRFARVRVAPGQRDPWWDPSPPPGVAPIVERAALTGWRAQLRDAVIGAGNRVLDLLGLGDSWVVVLRAAK